MIELLLLFILVYVLPCLMVGALGYGLNDHFRFYFWVSFFLTPVIGLIVVLYDKLHKGPGNSNDQSHYDAIYPGYRPGKNE